MPAGVEIWAGRLLFLPWEKHGGSATAINLRTILSCASEKVSVWSGLVEFQNLTVSGGRAAVVYNGMCTALTCVFPAAGVNGALFVRNGTVTLNDCAFAGGVGDAGVFVGDAGGTVAALYTNGGNTWGAGMTKYTPFGAVSTHITSNL